MEVKVNRKRFIEELKTGSMCAVKGKVDIPVLLYTRMKIENNMTFRLFSSDSKQTVNYAGTVENIIDYDSSHSDFMIDAKEFINILSTIKDEMVCLELLTHKNCVITHDKGQITLPLYPVDKYTPVMEIVNNSDNSIVIGTEENLTLLTEKLKKAYSFTGNDNFRPILNGVYINVNDGKIEIAATNSYMLYNDSTRCSSGCNNEAIIPSAMVNNIITLLQNGGESKILFFGGKIVLEVGENIKYSCSVIDGKYPNYKSIIPVDTRIQVEVNKEELKEAVKRQTYTTDSTNKCILKIQGIIPELGILSCNTDTGKFNHERIAAKTNGAGNEFSIAIKNEYLLTALDCVNAENVTLQLTEAYRPVLIQENNMNMVIMPMKIN